MLKTRPTLIILCFALYFTDVLFLGYAGAYLTNNFTFSVFKWAFLTAAGLHFPLFIAYTWKTWKSASTHSGQIKNN